MSWTGTNSSELYVTPMIRRIGFSIAPDAQVVQQDVGDTFVPVHYLTANCGFVEPGRILYIHYKIGLVAVSDNLGPGELRLQAYAQNASEPESPYIGDKAVLPYDGVAPLRPVGVLSMVTPNVGELRLTVEASMDAGRTSRFTITDGDVRSYLIVFDLGPA